VQKLSTSELLETCFITFQYPLPHIPVEGKGRYKRHT